MKKFISTVSAATVLALSSLAGIVPASAGPWHPTDYQQQDRYIGDFCDRNPNAGQCNDWRSNHSRWGNSQYQSFYRYHRNDSGFGGNLAAGLFGFAVGAALTGSPGYMSDHVRACENTYHSYNARTDTFLDHNGFHHACRP